MSEYIPNKVRIVAIEPVELPDGTIDRQLLVVTIETDDGEQYRFAIDFWDLARGRERVIDILLHWKQRVIPGRRLAEALSDEEYRKFIQQFIGLEV